MNFYPLLGRAARAELSPAELADLRHAVEQTCEWSGLLEQAELQRMAPLFYRHTRAAGADLPEEVRPGLQGLVLRHAAAAEVRAGVLKELLAQTRAAGMEIILLKGAATAYLSYPASALRPMRDLDILVRPADLPALLPVLQQMGFHTPASQSPLVISDKHLPHAELKISGLTITLETHTRLFDSLWRPHQPAAEDLFRRARSFEIDGQPALSLALEDLLWHTYQHLVIEDIRLIGIADLLSLSQRYADEIDWDFIRRRYPALPEALSVIHFLTPLPEGLIERAGIRIGRPPREIGRDWQGWPRIAYGRARGNPADFLKETFFPSDWFLRLYYGVGSTRPLWPTRFLRHPAHLASLAWLRLMKKR